MNTALYLLKRERINLSKKIKNSNQKYILNYVELLYKDILLMSAGEEEPIPYQLIFLPENKKEMDIYDKTSRKMLKVTQGTEVLIVSMKDDEGFVKTYSHSFPGGHAEIELKYIKDIGYN